MLELRCNRVYRPFVGGKLLEMFCGIKNPKDGHYPERWICSTTSTGDCKGISETLDGRLLTEYRNEPLDILVKLLDSYSRLMIQVHPDRRKAKKYFNSDYGKTEAWYILDTRIINGEEPYVFLGFKKGITRKIWEEIFYNQDIKAMENYLHKVPVKKGDIFYIPGGVPHAMGTGVFFAEIQEPTDITLRTEWKSPDGRDMLDVDINCGTSMKNMFDCFDYVGYSLEELLGKYKVERNGEIIVQSHMFTMKEIDIKEKKKIKVNDYAIVVVLEGKDKGREFFITEDTEFIGNEKLLVCYGKEI
jgi:mannose-6-phosphate isomerase